MNFRHVAAVIVVGGCSGTIEVQGVGSASGSTGTGGTTGDTAAVSTSVAGGEGGSVACPPGIPSQCLDTCPVESGGACACGAFDTSPNCPAGWWKVCCAGDGAPCDPPTMPEGVQVIPACGPGPAPAWCVSQPYPCP